MATEAELKAFAAQTTYSIPTIDYKVGVSAGVSLKDYHKIGAEVPGVIYDAKTNRVLIMTDNVNLSGYDFSGTNVVVRGQNAKITNCAFDAATGYYSLKQEDYASGLVVDHCTFDGKKVDRPEFADFIGGGKGKVTITNSSFMNSPTDMIFLSNGTVSNNYFADGGFAGSVTGTHPDAIWVSGTTGPVTISDNFIDMRVLSGDQWTNSAVRVTNEKGSVSDVSITNNVLLGGTYTVGITNRADNGATINAVSLKDNYIAGGQYGALYPGQQPADLACFNNATGSLGSLSLLQSTGATALSITGSPTKAVDIISGTAGADRLYGHGGGDRIIGGLGADWMYGGSGSDNFVFLSSNDSSPTGIDHIVNFEDGIDKIDLSSLISPYTNTVQHMNFIGEVAFDGRLNEVHTTLNLAYQQTMIEVDFNGDKRPDMRIQLDGIHHLTASDFKV